MTERIPENDWEAKLTVSPDGYMSDAFHLLVYFLSSKALAEISEQDSESHPNRALSSLAMRSSSELIPTLLLRIAATARAKEEDGSWWSRPDVKVGTWIPDLKDLNDSKVLTVREACNKILHAQRLHYDTGKSSTTNTEYLKQQVYLYGERGGKQWKATLDVVALCAEAYNTIF